MGCAWTNVGPRISRNPSQPSKIEGGNVVRSWSKIAWCCTVVPFVFLFLLISSVFAESDAEIGVSREDPGFTYGPASRDWVPSADYYFLENSRVKMTVGTVRLETGNTEDYGDDASGNNRWGTLTPGHMMDAAPKFNMRDNLDYTEFVLREQPHRTWWYPTEKLSMPDIRIQDQTIVASGEWDRDGKIKAQVTYELVDDSPLIRMTVTLTNTGSSPFNGHLGYIIDPEETLEQQSYVPGWGWRGGQVSEYITSGWNKNYIFNGIQDKYTGNTAHAIIWPDGQQPSALIPEGYITGAWFAVSLPAGESTERIIYHLPHNPGPAQESYRTAELWADWVKNGMDPASIGEITGSVIDAAGQPSAGIEIALYNEAGEKAAAAVTDRRGMFQMYAPAGERYRLVAGNGTDVQERVIDEWTPGKPVQVYFTMEAHTREIYAGVTKGDPGFVYEGTSRDWWPNNDYYYIESPDVKMTVGTVRTAGMDPVDWSNDASGNSKWGTLTRGHMMDAVPMLTRQENLDFTEFVLSDDLGVTPEDEANGKHMEWSWFHPLTKLEMPDIRLDGNAIVAQGDWDADDRMKAKVRYSIVEGTPLIRMEIELTNQTGSDFDGNFGYIVDPDQPGEQHSYLPGLGWVYSQEKRGIREGWTDNYIFNGINGTFTGKTAHAIIWPKEQQPEIVVHEGIFVGAWFDAYIPNGESKTYVIYHLPHVAGPAERPYAVAEFWAEFVRNHADPDDYASITGTITDEEGHPLAFMEVVVEDVDGTSSYKAVTNGEGKYQLYVKKGLYRIQPLTGEYSPETREVNVLTAKRAQADFALKKFAEVRLDLPEQISADSLFDIHVSIENLTDRPFEQVRVEIRPPYWVELLEEDSETVPAVGAGDRVQVTFKALALEGGRGTIAAEVHTDQFRAVRKTGFDVTGAGHYAGDNHSHTQYSDGVHSVSQNSGSVYDKKMLSWVWSTDHNQFSQKQDADTVTAQYGGKFLSLAGSEITTPYGHALAYGLDGAPRSDIGETGYVWQDSINEVTDQGGLFYIAHPFEPTYAFQTPHAWTGFTGVEVWNGSWHALDGVVNERAFRFWDEINIRGDGKYFGITNSDAHTKDKAGDPYIKGWLPSLTEDHVLGLLRSGNYFGTNGPELRFRIGGAEMGETLKIKAPGTVPFQIQAYDPNSRLTRVRVIRYPVTGNIADYEQRSVMFEQDLTAWNTNSFSQVVYLPVNGMEFYRLEVTSEKAAEGSTGIGPLAGTGFAYSNPIWVEIAEASNAAAIESIEYKNHNKSKDISRFGVHALEIYDTRFDPKKLDVKVSAGARVTVAYSEIPYDGKKVGLLDVEVTAEDGTRKHYQYLVYTIHVRDTKR
jgi:Predicted metal-dependent phosphoesterases (PHP family)